MEDAFADEQGLVYDLAIHWEVTRTCNLSCPQCAGKAVALKGSSVPERINIPALMKFLNNTEKVVKFIFTGGEPLFVDNIMEAFSEITKKHYIALFTNLVSPKVKEIADHIEPGRVAYIAASAHILELEKRKSVDIFISNCLRLKEKKFNLDVKEIAYPFISKKVGEYEKLFACYGINLLFMPFKGIWENKKYPDNYTDKEIELFHLNKNLYYNTNIFERKNKLCNVGNNVVVVTNDGKVQPCFSIRKNIGNIYKKIHFSKKLIKCPLKYCNCPFPIYEPYLFKKALI